MSKVTFRKADLERMIKAAESAGLKVGRIEIDNGGKITLIADNGTSEVAPEKAAEIVL